MSELTLKNRVESRKENGRDRSATRECMDKASEAKGRRGDVKG